MNNNKLNKFIEDSLALEVREAREVGSLGYMGRALIQSTMPHRKVIGNEFIRKNGVFTLSMISPSHIGLPYGSIPRLLMAWITTEAVTKKEQELILGDSLSDFMRELDLQPTGGKWGSITRLREQMKRLFTTSISFSYEDESSLSGINLHVAEEYSFWWEPKDAKADLWGSTIKLNKQFFDEITSNPVPVDIDALKLLKRSPMALDIYCWLTYRMSYLRRKTKIPWQVLESQFGSNYSKDNQGTRNFKKHFIQQLKKVVLVYPGLDIDAEVSSLILKPSKTHISVNK